MCLFFVGAFCTFSKNISKHFGTKSRLFLLRSVVQNVYFNISVLTNFLACLFNLCSKFSIFPPKNLKNTALKIRMRQFFKKMFKFIYFIIASNLILVNKHNTQTIQV